MVLSDMVRGCVCGCVDVEELCWLFFVLCGEQSASMCIMLRTPEQ
jgi:hypothetical protein